MERTYAVLESLTGSVRDMGGARLSSPLMNLNRRRVEPGFLPDHQALPYVA
jgi:hypothetical protein